MSSDWGIILAIVLIVAGISNLIALVAIARHLSRRGQRRQGADRPGPE